MKFAKTLAAESVPEWRAAYINYRGLKKKLTKIQHEVQAELERERERNASSTPNTPLLSPLLNRTRSALFGSLPNNGQSGIPDAPALVQQGRINSSSATALPPAIIGEAAAHRRYPSHLHFADEGLIQKSAPASRFGDDEHPSESIHDGGGVGDCGSHDDMEAPLLNGLMSSSTDADPDKEVLPLPQPPTQSSATRSADTYEPAGFTVNLPLCENLVDGAIQPMAPKHLYKALSSGSDGDDDEESPKSPMPPTPTSTPAKDPSIASAPPLTTQVHATTFHHSPLNPNRSPSPPRPASLPQPTHSHGSMSRFPIPLEQLRGLNSSEDLNEVIMEARLQSLTQPAPESPTQSGPAHSVVGSPQTFPRLHISPSFHGTNAAIPPNTRPTASVSSDEDIGAPTMGPRRMSFRDRARARVSSFRSNYSTLRKRLASSATLHDNNEPILPLDDYLAGRPAVERDFFKMLDSEMEKITKFFNEQVANHRATMAKIKELLADMQEAGRQSRVRSSSPTAAIADTLASLLGTSNDGGNAAAGSAVDRSFLHFLRPLSHGGSTKASRIKVLKSALLEEYKALTFLRNYQILNFTGLFKILKKFDKTTGWRSSRLYVAERAPLLTWDQDPSARNMLKDIEQLYCKHFAGGKRQDGMRELRLPDRRHATYQNATWLAGFYLGVGLCLFVQAVVSIFHNGMHHRPHFVPLVQIYGGFLMPILFSICIVGCLYKWSMHGVNYVFIFEFDFRDHIHYLQFLQLPSFVFLIWSVFVFLTLAPANDIIGINPLMLPIVFAGVIVAFFVNPLNVFHRSARYWLIRTLARVIASPFHKILFRDFFLTDILCSLVYTLTSLPLFFCVSIGGDIDCDPSRSFISLALALFPYATRFAQCIRRTYDSGNKHPHMTNAGKYFFGMCVISVSFKWRSSQEEEEWLIVWILLSICATVYAVSWDMFFDWGLMDPEHKLLRSELVFPSNAMYYFALVTNSLLRLGWVVQISPGHWFPTVPSSAIALTLAILEIFRRVQWCLYRMENEHLSNCGQFRATKEIPLPRVHHPSDEDDDLEAHGRHDGGGSSSDGDGSGGGGGVIRMLRMNSRAAVRERSQSRSRSPSPELILEEIRGES